MTTNRLDTMEFTGTLVIEECCACGITFAMPADMQRRRREDHGSFFCPAGHAQHYTGKSEEQKAKDRAARLEQQLTAQRAQTDQERARADHEAKRANGFKGAMVKAKKRSAKGVCPAPGCKRHFADVEAHIARKHPDFHEEPPS